MSEYGPYLIGITGNIACGKSLVSSILAEFGAEVIDADHVAHEVMNPGSVVLAQVAERFGQDMLNPDGSLNRRALGEIVFNDPAALVELERMTHPPTVATVLARARQSPARVVVVDAIKLFEAGLAEECDENWTVFCEPSVQVQRLRERNGFTEDEARMRIDAQPPQQEKIARADRMIDNSGDIAYTREQVAEAWASLPLAR